MADRALEEAEFERVFRLMLGQFGDRRVRTNPHHVHADEVNEVRHARRHLPYDHLDADSHGESDEDYEHDDNEIDDDDDPDDLPPLVRLDDDDDLGFGDFILPQRRRRQNGFGGGFFDLFGELIQQRNQEMMTSRMEVYLKQVREQDPALKSVDMTLSHRLCFALMRAMQKNKIISTLSVDLNDGSTPHILDELLKLLKVNGNIRRLELGDFEQLTSINRLLTRLVEETKKTQFRPRFTELVVRLFVPAASEQPTKGSVVYLFELLGQMPNVTTLELEVDLADIVVTQVHDEFIQMVKNSENIHLVQLDGTEEDHKEGCEKIETETRKICRFRRTEERDELLKKTSQGSLSLWPHILSKLVMEQENFSAAFSLMREMNGNLVPASF